MSYKEIGYQFLHYFADCINIKHQNILIHLKQDTMLTINDQEGLGPEQILNYLNLIHIHGLKIESKYVLIQPIFSNNSQKTEYNGLLILASGSVNIIENGIYVNKNVHFNIILENINGFYYMSNIIIRLSEKSRQINKPNNNYNQQQNYNTMDLG
jgi:hypothetical protein